MKANDDTKQSLTQQIATRKQAQYSMQGMSFHLPNPDPVLKKIGQDVTTYRDLISDAQVGGNVRRRRAALTSLEYGLNQGEASDTVTALCEKTLSRIPLNRLIKGLQDAAFYGFSPAEIIYEVVGGQWLPLDVVVKPPEWFAFNSDSELCFLPANVYSVSDAEAVPANKFIIARQDETYENPYGVGDLSRVYWPCTFKKGGLKFWLRYADKYGQAFLIGKHPRGTPDTEVVSILDALEQLAQDGVGAFPDDGSVEIMESAGKSGSADLYERLLAHCKSEINIGLIGQNQSTEKEATLASSKSGAEVASTIRDADAVMVADAINDLLSIIVRLNIGEGEVLPIWSMWEQEEVNEQLASRDEKITRAGARFTQKYFMRQYKLKEDEVTVDLPATGNQPSTSFSERSKFKPLTIDYADTATDALALAGAPVVGDWLKHIEQLLFDAASLEEFQTKLAGSLGDLDTFELTEVMALGLSAARLAGMSEVREEADADK